MRYSISISKLQSPISNLNSSYTRLVKIFMSVWDTYPSDYRNDEVRAIVSAAESGECTAVAGLSGSGKSNLLGFIANRITSDTCRFVLVDCNRINATMGATGGAHSGEYTSDAFFRLIRRHLGSTDATDDEWTLLDAVVEQRKREWGASICLLLDRFDGVATQASAAIFDNMRALRDAHKYTLTYVVATRRPMRDHSELAELFYAHILGLGILSESDAQWSVARYAARKGLTWDRPVADGLIALTRGYPSFLRAACEAYAAGASLDVGAIASHPAVKSRLEEFLNDNPTDEELRRARLEGLALLQVGRPARFDMSRLTAKENLLLTYLQAHPDGVCEKDDLIRAVWPEDHIFERGVRDDSLAQLVRRLREKIEPDPSVPSHIHTAPGRGYRFTP